MVAELASLLFMFTIDRSRGLLTGYGMVTHNNNLVAKELWTSNMLKETQSITNVVAKRQAGKYYLLLET